MLLLWLFHNKYRRKLSLVVESLLVLESLSLVLELL
jgi:hypothetical protein